MSRAIEIYRANVVVTHDAAVEAVWQTAYAVGYADALSIAAVAPSDVIVPSPADTAPDAGDASDATTNVQ